MEMHSISSKYVLISDLNSENKCICLINQFTIYAYICVYICIYVYIYIYKYRYIYPVEIYS